MRTYRFVPAVLLLLCILTACGGPVEPAATAPAPNDLLNFALLDRLFAMTLADFFEEGEGGKLPDDGYGESEFYTFSNYDPYFFFFFDPDTDSLNSISVDAKDLLVGRQSLTLGELKNWLEESEIAYDTSDYEGMRMDCYFTAGEYLVFVFTEYDNESDSAVVTRFSVQPKE